MFIKEIYFRIGFVFKEIFYINSNLPPHFLCRLVSSVAFVWFVIPIFIYLYQNIHRHISKYLLRNRINLLNKWLIFSKTIIPNSSMV